VTRRVPRSLVAVLGSLFVLSGLMPIAPVSVVAAETPVFINEIHYDNTGTDAGEFIEVAGPAGTDLTGWSIVLYNGTGGAPYDTDALTGTIPNQQNGFGTVSLGYPVNGIQNGAPDGIALVNSSSVVVQFLSYEGSFAAVGGVANGMTSTDIGVSEAGSEPLGQSLQLQGTGTRYEDFTWSAPIANTSGAVNTSQTFNAELTISINDVSANEGNGGTTTFNFTVSLSTAAPDGGVTFDIATADSTATTADNDYVAKSLTGQSIAAGSSTYTFDVTVNGDATAEPNESFFVNVTNVVGAAAADGQGIGTITNDDVAVTPIHDIQGNGDTAAPGTFVVEAIVVGDYQAQGPGQLRGFFLQEEDADVDADAATSEGIFVFCSGCPVAVSVGDAVRVSGSSSEFFGMSQLTASTVSSVTVLSSGNALPTPAGIELPVPGVPNGDLAAATAAINAYYEAFEGMLVTHPDTLSVTEYFELARYGQLLLSEGGRPHTFTAVNAPSASGLIDHEIDLARRTVILDDTDNRQNRPVDTPNTPYYHPVPGLSTANFVRGGDTITDLTGVLHWSFAGQTGTDAWRIRPVTEAFDYAFTSANPRPGSVPDVGGRLKVAGFNVLNYFLTIDTTSSTSAGPCGASQTLDCRGADSAAELQLQRDKMLAALSTIDADVFGLMELENTPGVDPLADIVAGLPGYDYIDTDVIGGDAIRVGFIYKTDSVEPIGDFAILDSSVDPDFDSSLNRPALAQTFEETATGARLTVVVNHLKSKGSGCGPGDDDTTTGQGNCNGTRTRAAGALADWLATDPTGSGDPDVLIIGDLNSYAKEDPIVALQGAGYSDLVNAFGGPGAYGFVFDGQLGYLDHGMSNEALTPQVTGAAEWHINADEIPLFDYNDAVRDVPGEATFEGESDVFPLYEANQFRSSDHDPVVVGLDLRLGPLHLHNNPTPPTGNTPMQHPLPMDADTPTASTLFNYDTDRDSSPGRLIQKGGTATSTDRKKFQNWRTQTFGQDVVIEGDVTFEFWSAITDFKTNKRGHIVAYLMDGATVIATASLNPTAPWQGGSRTWVQKSVTFVDVNDTIAAGSFLQLRVVVHSRSGSHMWFAYDTTSLQSRLIMP
jgi:predicted extracellular nuclease